MKKKLLLPEAIRGKPKTALKTNELSQAFLVKEGIEIYDKCQFMGSYEDNTSMQVRKIYVFTVLFGEFQIHVRKNRVLELGPRFAGKRVRLWVEGFRVWAIEDDERRVWCGGGGKIWETREDQTRWLNEESFSNRKKKDSYW